MKRFLAVSLGLLLLASTALAVDPVSEYKFGWHMPAGSEAGFIGTIAQGRSVDEAVDLTVALDIYGATRTEEEEVAADDPATPDITEETFKTTLESAVYSFPLTANATIRFTEAWRALRPYATAGVGYNLALYTYDNYETGDSERSLFHGLAIRGGAGLSYALGHSSDLVLEAFYQWSRPARSGDTEEGQPVRTELDLSGFGIRIGLRLLDMGFL